jgi:hypothetical protein
MQNLCRWQLFCKQWYKNGGAKSSFTKEAPLLRHMIPARVKIPVKPKKEAMNCFIASLLYG